MEKIVLALMLIAACAPIRRTNSNTLDSTSSAPTAAVQGFDVNDVSFLYPAVRGPLASSPYANYMPLSLKTAEGPILLQKQFEQTLDLVNRKGSPFTNLVNDYSKWLVVGVRFDPCAKLMPADTTCDGQIRLVVQPYIIEGSPAEVNLFDNAIHLIYHVDDKNVKGMVDAFIDLKKLSPVPTNGIQLGVHPAFIKEGVAGAFAKKLADIVSTYALPSHLERVAIMLLTDAAHWKFGTSAVKAGSDIKASPIPCHKETEAVFFGSTGTIGNFVLKALPPSECAGFNVNEIIDDTAKGDFIRHGSFYDLPQKKQAAAVQMAIKLTNPDVTGFANADCVACHAASRALTRAKDPAFLTIADGNANRFKVPTGVTSSLIVNSETTFEYGVGAFRWGVSVGVESINLFVLNDSMKVAERINKDYLGL